MVGKRLVPTDPLVLPPKKSFHTPRAQVLGTGYRTTTHPIIPVYWTDLEAEA